MMGRIREVRERVIMLLKKKEVPRGDVMTDGDQDTHKNAEIK